MLCSLSAKPAEMNPTKQRFIVIIVIVLRTFDPPGLPSLAGFDTRLDLGLRWHPPLLRLRQIHHRLAAHKPILKLQASKSPTLLPLTAAWQWRGSHSNPWWGVRYSSVNENPASVTVGPWCLTTAEQRVKIWLNYELGDPLKSSFRSNLTSSGEYLSSLWRSIITWSTVALFWGSTYCSGIITPRGRLQHWLNQILFFRVGQEWTLLFGRIPQMQSDGPSQILALSTARQGDSDS